MIYDGNLQVSRFNVEKVPHFIPEHFETAPKETTPNPDKDMLGNITELTVRNLLPGMTYTFTLIAANAAGDSDIEAINVSMPADGK